MIPFSTDFIFNCFHLFLHHQSYTILVPFPMLPLVLWISQLLSFSFPEVIALICHISDLFLAFRLWVNSH